MRIFLNGEDIDLEVFHLCVQPGAHIHVCNKRDVFPDGTFLPLPPSIFQDFNSEVVFLDNSPCATNPITLKPPRKGKPRDLDEFWEDCTKGVRVLPFLHSFIRLPPAIYTLFFPTEARRRGECTVEDLFWNIFELYKTVFKDQRGDCRSEAPQNRKIL